MKSDEQIERLINQVKNSGWVYNREHPISQHTIEVGVLEALTDLKEGRYEEPRLRRVFEDPEDFSDEFNMLHDVGYADAILWYLGKETISSRMGLVPDPDHVAVNDTFVSQA